MKKEEREADILVGYIGSMAQTNEKLLESRTGGSCTLDFEYLINETVKREVKTEMSDEWDLI